MKRKQILVIGNIILASPPDGFHQRPSSLGSGVRAGGVLTLSTVFIGNIVQLTCLLCNLTKKTKKKTC